MLNPVPLRHFLNKSCPVILETIRSLLWAIILSLSIITVYSLYPHVTYIQIVMKNYREGKGDLAGNFQGFGAASQGETHLER